MNSVPIAEGCVWPSIEATTRSSPSRYCGICSSSASLSCAMPRLRHLSGSNFISPPVVRKSPNGDRLSLWSCRRGRSRSPSLWRIIGRSRSGLPEAPACMAHAADISDAARGPDYLRASGGRGAPTGALTIAPHVEQVQATAEGSSFVTTGQSQLCGGQLRVLREGARRADSSTDWLSFMVAPGVVVIRLMVGLVVCSRGGVLVIEIKPASGWYEDRVMPMRAGVGSNAVYAVLRPSAIIPPTAVGIATLPIDGHAAAAPILKAELSAFRDEPDLGPGESRWISA